DVIVRRARALFEGEGISPSEREVVMRYLPCAAIAELLGLHARTIEDMARRLQWQRPAWYRAPRRGRHIDGLRANLRRLLDKLAASGTPCPSNQDIGRELDCSHASIIAQLRQLTEAGEIKTERRGGNVRRIILANGRATGWTVKARG